MVRSVEEVLKAEFGKSLSDENVHILDPFVGTGNFITRVMQEIRKTRIEQKYRNELHCNEVMLLPYYIASMNIEHAYLDLTNKYEPFEGICLVDTFELAEPKQAGFEFMSEANTERIRRQKRAPIFVVIGNPPYNMGQVNENDQNKNRKYKHMDKRVQETYVRASKATLRNKLSDPYVKAFRFASDRIRAGGGVIAFVSNNSFVDQIAFDGMRKYIAQEFDQIYVLDLGGNVRKNPKLSGTTHNVFGIQVGVAITLLIRGKEHEAGTQATIRYAAVGVDWKKELKYDQLSSWRSLTNVDWQTLEPDEKRTWLTEGQQDDFGSFISLSHRDSKFDSDPKTLFRLFSLGLATNRDLWVYGFGEIDVRTKVQRTIDSYLLRMRELQLQSKKLQQLSDGEIVRDDDDKKLKWTDKLIDALRNQERIAFDPERIRLAAYRPFERRLVYFDGLLNQRQYQQHRIFPTRTSGNISICVNDIGYRSPLSVLAVNAIPDLHICAGSDGFQTFPFYTYDEDGSNCRENITDWALAEFRSHYGDRSLTKWDIFHYTYALLHHPEYRTRYASNLKRELPRIPFAPEFRRYAETGERLMDIHINYEQQPEHPLEHIENPSEKLDWRVEKMSLSKDKTELRYNRFLTLRGIPPDAYEYRLGNRSALEWIVDQYRVSTDTRSGIKNDPNRDDDPEYIARLIGQVVSVSLETVRLVRELSQFPLLADERATAVLPADC
jgi:predicted helicase